MSETGDVPGRQTLSAGRFNSYQETAERGTKSGSRGIIIPISFYLNEPASLKSMNTSLLTCGKPWAGGATTGLISTFTVAGSVRPTKSLAV